MDYTAEIGSLVGGNALEFGLIGGLGILAIVVWTIVWKGLALWHAAKNGHKIWFVALLILNTIGILEIVYFFFFRKKGQKGQQVVEENFPAKDPEEEPKEAL